VAFPPDQIPELKLLCDTVASCDEAAVTYLLLGGLNLPANCVPAKVDALLCVTEREGYPSRLFFAAQVQSPFARNWNFSGQICQRQWHAYSWKVPGTMRLAQLVRAHLDGFRRAA
jgi:hypothetical protein